MLSFLLPCVCGLQVDCALSLVRLAKERKIPGLQQLGDDLVTMETLVYETSCELSLTLKDLQQLSDIDKLHLLMKNVSGPFTRRLSISKMGHFLKLEVKNSSLIVVKLLF